MGTRGGRNHCAAFCCHGTPLHVEEFLHAGNHVFGSVFVERKQANQQSPFLICVHTTGLALRRKAAIGIRFANDGSQYGSLVVEVPVLGAA